MSEPIDVPSQTVADTTSEVLNSLPTNIPSGPIAPTYQLTGDNRYYLYGSLFGPGDIYALIELPVRDGRFAFAQFVSGKWVLRGLWNSPVTWRPKGWVKSDGDYLPTTPAEKPFELQDFDGDSIPEVLVAGEVQKYYQAWYLLRFDPKAKRLRLLAEAMSKPQKAEGYILLSFNSGHLSIWGETDFFRWDNGQLYQVASWRNETPYNGIDPEFNEAGIYKRDGTKNIFHIEGTVNVSKNEDIYEIKKDNEHFATITFKPDKPVAPISTVAIMEDAWLFEHFTKVSGRLLPWTEDAPNTPSFEGHGTIRIQGSKEAIKLLQGKPSNVKIQAFD